MLGSISVNFENFSKLLRRAIRELLTGFSWQSCYWARFTNLLLQISFFTSLHVFSIGLRSGLFEGHSRTFTLFCWKQFETNVAVCFGSLSLLRFGWLFEVSLQCFQVLLFLIIPFNFWGSPVPQAAKQPHDLRLSPPCHVTFWSCLGTNYGWIWMGTRLHSQNPLQLSASTLAG